MEEDTRYDEEDCIIPAVKSMDRLIDAIDNLSQSLPQVWLTSHTEFIDDIYCIQCGNVLKHKNKEE